MGKRGDIMKRVFGGIIILTIFLVISPVYGQSFPDKPFSRLGKSTISQVAFSPNGKLLLRELY